LQSWLKTKNKAEITSQRRLSGVEAPYGLYTEEIPRNILSFKITILMIICYTYLLGKWLFLSNAIFQPVNFTVGVTVLMIY